MNGRNGASLLEMIVYLAVFTALLGTMGLLLSDLLMRHAILSGMEDELDSAGRFLHDVKSDLRRASKIEIDADRLAITFPGGERVAYRLLQETGTITRSGSGAEDAYPSFCESLRFERGTDGAVFVTTKLLNPDPGSPARPVLRAMAVPRNLEQFP